MIVTKLLLILIFILNYFLGVAVGYNTQKGCWNNPINNEGTGKNKFSYFIDIGNYRFGINKIK